MNGYIQLKLSYCKTFLGIGIATPKYPIAHHSHKIIQFTFSLVHGPDSRSIMRWAQHIIEVACDIKITMHGLSNPHNQNPIQSTRKTNTWVGLDWVRPVPSIGHLPSTHITVEVANIAWCSHRPNGKSGTRTTSRSCSTVSPSTSMLPRTRGGCLGPCLGCQSPASMPSTPSSWSSMARPASLPTSCPSPTKTPTSTAMTRHKRAP